MAFLQGMLIIWCLYSTVFIYILKLIYCALSISEDASAFLTLALFINEPFFQVYLVSEWVDGIREKMSGSSDPTLSQCGMSCRLKQAYYATPAGFAKSPWGLSLARGTIFWAPMFKGNVVVYVHALLTDSAYVNGWLQGCFHGADGVGAAGGMFVCLSWREV